MLARGARDLLIRLYRIRRPGLYPCLVAQVKIHEIAEFRGRVRHSIRSSDTAASGA